MQYIEIDYETQAIQNRPAYPPEPVGVAIRINGKGKYYAWGHPTENNCTFEEGKAALKAALETPGAEFVAHNSRQTTPPTSPAGATTPHPRSPDRGGYTPHCPRSGIPAAVVPLDCGP